MRLISVLTAIIGLTSVSGAFHFVSDRSTNAAFPGQDGPILYVDRVSSEVAHIWKMNPDGGGKTQMTFGDNVDDYAPAWSSDGTRFVFRRGGTGGSNGIWVMNASGSDGHLIPGTGNGYEPSWVPGQNAIVFAMYAGGESEIARINIDGTGFQALTNTNTQNESSPAVSPDGSRIAYQNYTEGDDTSDVWVMDVNGLNRTPLTTDDSRDEGSPDWSPDGVRLVYTVHPVGTGDTEIAFINADKTNPVDLTDATYRDVYAVYAPSGNRLVLESSVNTTITGGTPSSYIITMDLNGANRLTLSELGAVHNYSPSWGVAASAVSPSPSPSLSPSPSTSPSPTTSPTATPTSSPVGSLTWGNSNCNGGLTPVDILPVAYAMAGLNPDSGACPLEVPQTIVTVLHGTLHWGDWDCSGQLGPTDTGIFLKFLATGVTETPQGCPTLGSTVELVSG